MQWWTISTYLKSNELTPLRQDVALDTIIGAVKSDSTNQERKYQNVRQRSSHIHNLHIANKQSLRIVIVVNNTVKTATSKGKQIILSS